jgi:hypothetical protein
MPETYPWDVESNRSACAVRVRCSCTLTPTDDGHATSARHGRRFGWLTPVRALPLALPARPLLGQLLFCPFHCGWHPHLLYSTSTSWERDDCFVLVPGCVRREPDALRCVGGRRHLFPVFHSWAVARSGGRKAAGTTGPRRLFFFSIEQCATPFSGEGNMACSWVYATKARRESLCFRRAARRGAMPRCWCPCGAGARTVLR